MIVKDYMTRHPLMAEPSMSIIEAQRYMGENNVRHLPVVGDGKRLLGLVTRQTLMVDPGRLGSLNVWEIARYLSGLTVKDIMIRAKDVVTIAPDLTIEEAARVMVEQKVGCLPVVEEGVLVGILTETDLLVELYSLMGGDAPGVRLTIRIPDKKGELAKITGAISSQGWGVWAIGGVPAPKRPGYWDAVVKVRDVPQDELAAVLKKIAGHKIIDAREIK